MALEALEARVALMAVLGPGPGVLMMVVLQEERRFRGGGGWIVVRGVTAFGRASGIGITSLVVKGVTAAFLNG